MKFYNREKELANLQDIGLLSQTSSKMSIIVGRRRIGKTSLIKHVYKQKIYLFVSKKEEALLCEEFVSIIKNALDIKILGDFSSFAKLFEHLMILAQTTSFTLVIDEFQEFLSINETIYSDMQNIWDEYKETTKMNLVLSGSIYSLMKRIFEDKKEPLFGRANNKIDLKALSVLTLKEILQDNYPNYTKEDLLCLYTFTGGVAKYVEIFVDKKAFTFEKQLEVMLEEHSLFLEEGKNLLIEEFGKHFTTYFSILSLIASSKTSRSQIESILEKNIGGYLDRLEHEYSIIKKIKPIFAKEGSRSVKYEIVDNFLNFWFRFVYKNKSAIEIENYEYVKQIIRRDFSMYSGKMLERFMIEKLKLSHNFSNIGTYWESKNQNEIDIVAVNELEKSMIIAEVKINSQKIDLEALKKKSSLLVSKYSSYTIWYRGYSLDDL